MGGYVWPMERSEGSNEEGCPATDVMGFFSITIPITEHCAHLIPKLTLDRALALPPHARETILSLLRCILTYPVRRRRHIRRRYLSFPSGAAGASFLPKRARLHF